MSEKEQTYTFSLVSTQEWKDLPTRRGGIFQPLNRTVYIRERRGERIPITQGPKAGMYLRDVRYVFWASYHDLFDLTVPYKDDVGFPLSVRNCEDISLWKEFVAYYPSGRMPKMDEVMLDPHESVAWPATSQEAGAITFIGYPTARFPMYLNSFKKFCEEEIQLLKEKKIEKITSQHIHDYITRIWKSIVSEEGYDGKDSRHGSDNSMAAIMARWCMESGVEWYKYFDMKNSNAEKSLLSGIIATNDAAKNRYQLFGHLFEPLKEDEVVETTLIDRNKELTKTAKFEKIWEAGVKRRLRERRKEGRRKK